MHRQYFVPELGLVPWKKEIQIWKENIAFLANILEIGWAIYWIRLSLSFKASAY